MFIIKSIAMLAAYTLVLEAAAPHGWYLAGSKPSDYDCDVEAQMIYNNHPSAYLKAKRTGIDGFGTLMQDFRADQYLGKRVRFTAFVKTEGIGAEDWAGLWMRVDKASGDSGDKTPAMLAFDNMQNRPIKETAGWQNYEVVLDVPQDATGIFFGILLHGSGSAWLNSVKFEAVGLDVPTTGKTMARARSERPAGPTNLSFEK